MVIQMPTLKLGDKSWFLNDKDEVLNGEVKLITLAISTEGTNVYYSMVSDNKWFNIKESDLIPTHGKIPKPIYEKGDKVTFRCLDSKGSEIVIDDAIETVTIEQYDKDKYEVYYYMEGDSEYWIRECEVYGFALDPKLQDMTRDLVE